VWERRDRSEKIVEPWILLAAIRVGVVTLRAEEAAAWSVNVLCCANRGIQNQNQNQNQKDLPGYLY
jgi:hypothetical protein